MNVLIAVMGVEKNNPPTSTQERIRWEHAARKEIQPTKNSCRALSVIMEGNSAVEMETACNMYFPILPCKCFAKGTAADWQRSCREQRAEISRWDWNKGWFKDDRTLLACKISYAATTVWDTWICIHRYISVALGLRCFTMGAATNQTLLTQSACLVQNKHNLRGHDALDFSSSDDLGGARHKSGTLQTLHQFKDHTVHIVWFTGLE